MFHGSFPRTGRPRLVAIALAGLLAGCSGYTSLNYESYPAHLKYPQRHDLIVKDKPTPEQRHLPSPGHLDESIIKACAPGSGAKTFNPADLKKDDAAELSKALDTVFGKPSRPLVVPPEDSAAADDFVAWRDQVMGALGYTNVGAIDNLELDPDTLRRGSKLYRRHCMHCHGLAGDGRGPTGPWVNPYPRDYRSGQFKFISTAGAPAVPIRKPRRDDLLRILHNGIDGTSMPAFGLLPEHELRYLASYVTHLSIRGQVEMETMIALLDVNDKGERNQPLEKFEGKRETDLSPIADHVYSRTANILLAWARSSDAESLKPPAYTEPADPAARNESIRAGHKLFVVKAGCIACHADYGRQVTFRYDVWGTLVRPYNLTNNVYRGGRRPVDLYWRVRGGIEPSGMPAVANLSEAEYWQLVDFVKALPYPAMLPDDVRQAVYGGGTKKEEKQASAK